MGNVNARPSEIVHAMVRVSVTVIALVLSLSYCHGDCHGFCRCGWCVHGVLVSAILILCGIDGDGAWKITFQKPFTSAIFERMTGEARTS